MITFSGKFVDLDLKELPSEADFVAGLCRINRYAGAIWCPLLAHSVLVAELGYRVSEGSDIVFAYGFVHDFCEAVTGDVCFPFKSKEQKAAEDKVQAAIEKGFGLTLKGNESVEDAVRKLVDWADKRALTLEASVLGLPRYEEYQRLHWGEYKAPTPQEEVFAVPILTKYREPEMVSLRGNAVQWATAAMASASARNWSKARRFLLEHVLALNDDWRDWE